MVGKEGAEEEEMQPGVNVLFLLRLFFLIGVSLIIPSTSFAEVELIYATHKYVMGDNDSKNDARRMCFLEAKRTVLEKAGTYIESFTEVRNAQLTKDEIFAYSAALLTIETVKEQWKQVGENMTVRMTVKANVDKSYILTQLVKIRSDASVQKKIIVQQKKVQELERRVLKLQKALETTDGSKVAILRKDRNIVFRDIYDLENLRIEIMSNIRASTRDALSYVERGMTPAEVKSLIGAPRATNSLVSNLYLNYGDVWLIFESDVLRCVIYSQCFNVSKYLCSYYYNKCVAK